MSELVKHILYIEDLTVSFDGFKALDGLNFYVEINELRVVIGPNGAGKSTLLDVICGKTRPEKGEVLFYEKIDLKKLKEHEIARLGIGRKFQTPSIYEDLTVLENLTISYPKKKTVFSALFFKLSPMDKEKIEEMLHFVGLIDKRHLKAGLLSHGEKQWLEIAMILIQNPKLVLLDEPVAGMSAKEREKTVSLLKKIAPGRSMVVIEHDMEFVKNIAQRVTVLHQGKVLCEGNIERIQNDPKVQEVYLGGYKVATN
ncbi:urea ABC transporter, ATP-binding protein UrtD [Thermodesulfatator indicus DSM 15286]|uniref:Urea ABC transporter, ATP-binding protein UrtD n=1 Tax=Thermodesulfatator indicus (strain DSM 15286 / JCM 11887 / CIR29812) TaxID=667014 RepID=F8A821_THEID|nr:urea ABC transporter ATP-binding protein UrtD [Thermodesulfatator indicus]AEH45014.1 urea ABC transporter, ATP-binding protein UrtD [Thermodesulfatator indicus DSM 15286]